MGELKRADWLKEKLGLDSKQVAYRIARENLVPSVRIGKRLRFDEDEIEAFIQAGGKPLESDEETDDLEL